MQPGITPLLTFLSLVLTHRRSRIPPWRRRAAAGDAPPPRCPNLPPANPVVATFQSHNLPLNLHRCSALPRPSRRPVNPSCSRFGRRRPAPLLSGASPMLLRPASNEYLTWPGAGGAVAPLVPPLSPASAISSQRRRPHTVSCYPLSLTLLVYVLLDASHWCELVMLYWLIALMITYLCYCWVLFDLITASDTPNL
jgi:hypothetical protein